MTPADLEYSLDGVSRNLESSRERTDGSAVLIAKSDRETGTVGEFGVQSPPLIHGLSDRLNVFGVHAETVAAEMVSLKWMRPGADTLLPDCAVGSNPFVSHSHLSIAALANGGTVPDPAGSGIPSVLGRKVPLINQSHPLSHTDTPYMTFSMRVEQEGYEAP